MRVGTDDWSLKEVQPNGSDERWFFRKNLNPTVAPGDPRFCYVGYVTLRYEPRDSSGLPSSVDADSFAEIEERLIPEIESAGESVQVGAVLKAGVKDLVFYVQQPDALGALLHKVRSQYPQFLLEYEIVSDPSWEHYADFP